MVKTKKLPTSGSEEPFTNFVYAGKSGKKANNCYAYAIDKYKEKQNVKLQPGQLSKTLKLGDDLTKCPILMKRTLDDLKTKKNGGYVAKVDEKCRPGYYKIVGVVDPDHDYHWYRQMSDILLRDPEPLNVNKIKKNTGANVNSPSGNKTKPCDPVLIKKSGLFCHKRGLAQLTCKDASGDFISDPRNANRNYGNLNYSKVCGGFCVSKKFGVGK